jgi:uncharacterized membrane protein
MKHLATYSITALVFCALDILWVTYVVHDIFKAQIPLLLAAQPNLYAAAVFYVAYPIGIVVLAIVPASRHPSRWMAFALGALLGLMAYGTYETTNLATLKDWTWKLLAIDTSWGTFVTAVSAAAGSFAFNRLGRR